MTKLLTLNFYLGDKIEINNKYKALVIKLSEIIDKLYTFKRTNNNLVILIEDHHKMFKMLYPEIKLKIKHHNMIHYATAIRRIGSLVDYCTLWFEGKYTLFKTAQRASHNYKNIP